MIFATQESIKKYTQLGVWSETTLIDYFKSHVKSNPDKVCLVDPYDREALTGIKPERLTYAQFDHAIDATAGALSRLGIGKDDIVVVQLPNVWELAMLYLAIARAGAVITPVPVQWRKAELKHVAGLTRAKALITLSDFHSFHHIELGKMLQKELPTLKHVLSLNEIREMSRGETDNIMDLDKIDIDANDIFTICWTSGTEARPKGCPMSHNNWKGAMAVQEPAGIQPGDILLTAGPLVNMGSVGTVFIPWIILGGTLVLHHPFNPTVFMQQIAMEKVNYTLLVPAVINMIAKHPRVDSFKLDSIRSITVGSAPPSLWSVQEFKRRWNINIGNIWGQNEGTGIVSGVDDVPDIKLRVSHFPQYGKPGSHWKSACSNFIETKIIDTNGREMTKVNDTGELVYKGPGVIARYYKNPEATKNSFTKDGFFRTGDRFVIKENDLISFYDRQKDIIIRGGNNISAQEIENYIFAHPKVKDVAIVSMPDERLGEKVCAYIVPKEGNTVTINELTSFLEEKGVAKYKWPERIEIIDFIPRNPVGKILKNILREDIRKKTPG